MKHPPEELLLEYAAGNEVQLEGHVRACAPCRRIAESYSQLARSLGARLIWAGPEAESGKQPVVSETPLETEARETLRSAHAWLETSPARALDAAASALEIVGSMSGPSEAIDFFSAWSQRERANALRYLGRYHEALSALYDAQEHAERLPVSDFELALIAYIRATVLRELHRYDQAREQAEYAARIFRDFGDRGREMHALFGLANISFASGGIQEAESRYRTLLSTAAGLNDTVMRARVHHNLGNTLQQIGDASGAREHLERALRAYPEETMQTERARVRWSLARVTQSEGDAAQAVEELEAAADELARLGLPVDAALARLDSIDLLLALGRADAAAELGRAAAETFLAATMPVEAAAAMAQLRTAASSGNITGDVTTMARTVLERTLSPGVSR